jgi:predicted site-specific integrase-resolvase
LSLGKAEEFLGNEIQAKASKTALYCRASNQGRKDGSANQIEFLKAETDMGVELKCSPKSFSRLEKLLEKDVCGAATADNGGMPLKEGRCKARRE